MRQRGGVWAIVLAAGEGARVHSLTTDADGRPVPKQYCAPGGRGPMIRWAIERAGRVVPRRNIVAVVAEQHRQWWEPGLFDLPRDNVVVQPLNRGTAAGILLPLLHVLDRDPRASVLVLPSDHWVEDEEAIGRAMRAATRLARRDGQRLVLLGIAPRQPGDGYGWIVPNGPPVGARGVAEFVEKPDPQVAAALLRAGALINSLIFAARGDALVRLFALTLPGLLRSLLGWRERDGDAADGPGLREVYEPLVGGDFSREVLQRAPDRLRVVAVRECGWTDLGTPDRLRPFQRLAPTAVAAGARTPRQAPPADRPAPR